MEVLLIMLNEIFNYNSNTPIVRRIVFFWWTSVFLIFGRCSLHPSIVRRMSNAISNGAEIFVEFKKNITSKLK